jgi:hypothetical protein
MGSIGKPEQIQEPIPVNISKSHFFKAARRWHSLIGIHTKLPISVTNQEMRPCFAQNDCIGDAGSVGVE